MNKVLAGKFLASIGHERDQDVETTSRLLNTLPLAKIIEAGYAINNLIFENLRTGLAGKLYMELGPDHAIDSEISKGDIKVGDVVLIKPKGSSTRSKAKKDKTKSNNEGKDECECNGVVSKITGKKVVVTVDESQEDSASKICSFQRLYILKTTNTITYQRMESTMRKLAEFESIPNNQVIQYLLNDRPFHLRKDAAEIDFHNKTLNGPQRDAIKFSLANDISVIHGPPGTGKTFTLVELIQQLCDRGQRVLVCGPSNMAVDTILERLAKVLPGNLLLRIGHPARLLSSNLAHSLEILSKSGSSGLIVKDIMNEIDRMIGSIKKMKSYKDRRQGWQEVRELRKELRYREKKVVSDLILEARVIVATLHGSSSKELCNVYNQTPKLFDTLIIDEVSQSLEPQCWIPLMSHYKSNITKLVLAGDNKQLPPTIKSEDNKRVQEILGRTLFDRLEQTFGESIKCLLTVQYRMNETIMGFPSEAMYQNKLLADVSVASRTLADLYEVSRNEETIEPLIWYDTQGGDFPESLDEAEDIASSKYNENEAYLVKSHIRILIESNVTQESIGVIAPYSAQVSLLKKLIGEEFPEVTISTVDGFQGREKEVIILTLVRSNDNFEVGFLKEPRRLNVAMTRPKKQLCVIGDIENLQRSNVTFLKQWSKWCEDNADIRYPNIDDIS